MNSVEPAVEPAVEPVLVLDKYVFLRPTPPCPFDRVVLCYNSNLLNFSSVINITSHHHVVQEHRHAGGCWHCHCPASEQHVHL